MTPRLIFNQIIHMKRILFVAAFASLFWQTGAAQDLVWAKGFAWLTTSMSTTVDADGNLYLAGFDIGNHDIDPGPAVWSIPGPSNKAVAFVAKFDPSGQPLWLRSVGAPDAFMYFTGPASLGNPGNHILEVDATGHVHVLFSVQSTDSGKVYVYPGPSDTITTGASDVLFTFNPDGEFIFAEVIFGNSTCRSTDFQVHSGGRITVVGFFEGTIFPGSASRTQVSAGQTDGFIYQYNPFNYNVFETRSRRIGGAQRDYCYGIAADAEGNLRVGGMFFGDCDVDPSDTESFWLSLQSGQLHNGYLMKCSDALDFEWAQRYQTGGILPTRVATDAAGNAYASTHVQGGVQVNRYTSGGVLDNVYYLGDNTLNATALEHLQFRVDQAGDLHCWRPENSMTNDRTDAVYKKIDGETGEVLSELRFPATVWSGSQGMALDALGNIFLTGSFEGTIDLDPGAAEQLYTAAAPYPQRVFWVKLNEQCPSLGLKFQDVAPVGCDADGGARAVAFGGTAPYSYEWETLPVLSDSIAHFSQKGYYAIQVTDAAGCHRRREVWIDGVFDNAPGLFDLEVRPIFATEFRPGFPALIHCSAANLGCNPVDGRLKLALDPLLQLLSADPPPAAIEADTLIWQQTQWNYNEPLQVTLEVWLPNFAILGHLIHLRAWAETPDETLLSNNLQLFRDTIIGSYDPNDIAAAPEGVCEEKAILPAEKLTYSIRFQNTGTASAINVRILDTLPAQLDLSTLRVLASSHDMVVERLDSVTLAFVFEGIHLPDSSSNEPGSQGFVQFEIAQKPNGTLGAIIRNRAAIYFDFNEPVITNTVARTVADPLPECPVVAVGEASDSDLQFSVFPNPAKAGQPVRIVLENDYFGPLKIEMFSADGRNLNNVLTTKKTQKHTVLLEKLPYLESTSTRLIRISDGQRFASKWVTIIP